MARCLYLQVCVKRGEDAVHHSAEWRLLVSAEAVAVLSGVEVSVSVPDGTVSLRLDGREQGETQLTTEALDLPEHRKARGAFFTPPALAAYAARWAVRAPSDAVLEPSCGEAAFMLAAGLRQRELGGNSGQLVGYELHAESALRARGVLAREGYASHIAVGDFLEVPPEPRYAAVVGNPPYIRYQGFTGASREAGRRAAAAQGLSLSGLASSWAPFLAHASAFLVPEGRLALVLPAELLAANYAADVREFLLRRFATVQIVLFDRQVFPGVQTEAVLLMAEGTGGASGVAFGRVRSLEQLESVRFDVLLRPTDPRGKWTHALLSASATATLDRLRSAEQFTQLGTWGRIALGAVTGNNRYFTLTPRGAADRGLTPSDLIRISPPGSSHLRQLSVGSSDWRRLGDDGARTLLFRPTKPSPAALRYIQEGEASGVDQAYKCRVRSPWWQVPLPAAPDLFFTYMNADTVQLCGNPARLRHLNSVHGLYLGEAYRGLGQLLALASLNSATMLSAETVGRAYGGGILKMEPREAIALAVPSPALVAHAAEGLRRVEPSVLRAVRAGRLADAVGLVDDVVLREGAGLEEDLIHEVRRGRNLLANRRHGRRKADVSTDG